MSLRGLMVQQSANSVQKDLDGVEYWLNYQDKMKWE